MNKMIRLSLTLDMAFVEVDVFEGLCDRAQEAYWVSYLGRYIMDDYGNAVELDVWGTMLDEW